MNPRFSMNVVTTWNWDLGTCVDTYARLGIPAIGLTRASVAQFGPDKAPKRIRDAGLKVASYSGITSRGVGSDNSKAALDDACKQMDIGATLGATCLYTISGPREGLSWEEAGKRFQQGVAALVPQAEKRNVRLAIEPVHPMRQDLTFLNTARDTVRLIKPFPASRVGYVCDFYHIWWESDILDTIRTAPERIFTVQLSDHKSKTLKTMDRGMLGKGIMPLPQMLRAVEATSYKGYYDIEVISDDMQQMGYENAVKQIIADFDALWAKTHA